MKIFKLLTLIAFLTFAQSGFAQTEIKKIGFIGSLSSFAGSYGTAVLEGAQLAIKELNKEGKRYELIVEDDHSQAKDSVSAYQKLVQSNKVAGIISGTWWANSFVQLAEKDNIPVLSSETLYDKDTVPTKSYYILQGDLRNWIRVYEPLVKKNNWKTGAAIRFTSGFAETLSDEFQKLFSKEGRSFLGESVYADINVSEAQSLAVKIKQLNADVLLIDAQPAGLATILKRLSEQGLSHKVILTSSIAKDVYTEKLLDLKNFPNLYYTYRSNYSQDLKDKFLAEYKKSPILQSDLGYYSAFILDKIISLGPNATDSNKSFSVVGKTFSFDDKNVASNSDLKISTFIEGEPKELNAF